MLAVPTRWLSHWSSRWPPLVVPWLVLAVLAAAATAGLLEHRRTAEAPYLLVTREVRSQPLVALASYAAVLAVLGLAFTGVVRWVRGREAEPFRPPAPRLLARAPGLLDHVFDRWWRLAAVLVLVWLPWYVTSFPGQPSPDAANMMTEFLQDRSDFTGPALGTPETTAPYEDYPTSAHLVPDGERLWSNHHPFFVMLLFGSSAWVSIELTGGVVAGVVFLSAASALLALVGFTRALSLLGRLVTDWRPRALALGVLAATPLIPLWSLSLHKNQLFAAAFVWWLALLARHLHGSEPVGGRWIGETSLVSLLMAVSVQFGWIVLVAQAAALLLVGRRRWAPLVALAVPALLVQGSVGLLTASGTVIPSDPVETRAVQLQTLALIVREHPDALTAEERDRLAPLFDLDAMVADFNPQTFDPMKSTGPVAGHKSGTFRWRTVQPSDWDGFDDLVTAVAARHPDTVVDSLFLKSFRYVDPLGEGTNFYPPWSPTYERRVGGHQVAPVDLNASARSQVQAYGHRCFYSPLCRPTMSHAVKTVAVLLLLAAGIAARRRHAWLWALPFALQLAIAGASPLSASGRYVLPFTFALAVVVLLLAVPDRHAEQGPGCRRRLEDRGEVVASSRSSSADGVPGEHMGSVVRPSSARGS